jgi:hypothetical protein
MSVRFTERHGDAEPRSPRVSAPLRLCVRLLLIVIASGCSHAPAPPPSPAASSSGSDWSQFEGGATRVDPKNVRVVPASPIEITGVPFVHAVRLAWSTSDDVPSFEPEHETLRLPSTARQAVLLVGVAEMPDDAKIRVEWYVGNARVFTDALQSREDGEHYFALVKREGGRLEALPKGEYRADVRTADTLVKSVRFEVKA